MWQGGRIEVIAAYRQGLSEVIFEVADALASERSRKARHRGLAHACPGCDIGNRCFGDIGEITENHGRESALRLGAILCPAADTRDYVLRRLHIHAPERRMPVPASKR